MQKIFLFLYLVTYLLCHTSVICCLFPCVVILITDARRFIVGYTAGVYSCKCVRVLRSFSIPLKTWEGLDSRRGLY